LNTGAGDAAGLIVGGLALIGVVTATLASWIVERVADQNTKTVNATEAQVEQLRVEIAELNDLVRELRPTS
jgi:voltage-gated potassium channel